VSGSLSLLTVVAPRNHLAQLSANRKLKTRRQGCQAVLQTIPDSPSSDRRVTHQLLETTSLFGDSSLRNTPAVQSSGACEDHGRPQYNRPCPAS
jgi:hypothetical protein